MALTEKHEDQTSVFEVTFDDSTSEAMNSKLWEEQNQMIAKCAVINL